MLIFRLGIMPYVGYPVASHSPVGCPVVPVGCPVSPVGSPCPVSPVGSPCPVGPVDSVVSVGLECEIDYSLNFLYNTPVTSTKSRSSSASSFLSDSNYSDSNGSISSPSIENFAAFQVIDNPTDSNTATRLVPRSRLEELEYINANISSIIEDAIQNYRHSNS